MQNTLPKAILTTLAIAQLSYRAINFLDEPPRERVTTSIINAQFTPDVRFSEVNDDSNLVEVVPMESTPAIAHEVLAMNDLVEIGAILFKESRDVYADEVEMIRAYLANKYTEI